MRSTSRNLPLALAWVGARLHHAALDQLIAWQERARQRHALMQLSGAGLRDIGLTRTEAEREGTKVFWRP